MTRHSLGHLECRLSAHSRAFVPRKPLRPRILLAISPIARQRPSFLSLIHFTIAGSRCEKKLLAPVSSVAMVSISSPDSS